jgi:transposase-like protein
MHHTWSGAEAAVSGAWVTKLRRGRLTLLVVIDGPRRCARQLPTLSASARLIHRCHQHKKRNVTDALPERMRATVRGAMNQAYATRDPQRARRLLEHLARRLESAHPGAAASLRERLEETLTTTFDDRLHDFRSQRGQPEQTAYITFAVTPSGSMGHDHDAYADASKPAGQGPTSDCRIP